MTYLLGLDAYIIIYWSFRKEPTCSNVEPSYKFSFHTFKVLHDVDQKSILDHLNFEKHTTIDFCIVRYGFDFRECNALVFTTSGLTTPGLCEFHALTHCPLRLGPTVGLTWPEDDMHIMVQSGKANSRAESQPTTRRYKTTPLFKSNITAPEQWRGSKFLATCAGHYRSCYLHRAGLWRCVKKNREKCSLHS